MASVSVMPCSVVLRRLSADMSTDATSGNALYALSTSALNDKGLGSETSAFTSFSLERYDSYSLKWIVDLRDFINQNSVF